MTLWHLLRAACFLMPTVAALVSAKHAEVGFGGYTLTLTIAVVLGVGSAWTMEVAARAVATRSERHSASLREWYFRALYFAAVLWILFTGIVGGRVATIACMYVQRRFTH